LRPATAARDRSPPGPHRSALPRTDGPLLAGSLEGVRSVGAVKRCLFTAGNGCEGPQPSRPTPIIVATNESPLLADSLEGVRSVGAVKWCLFTAGNGCEGPQPSRPSPVIVATNGGAIAGRFPGGRSLRRRRETVLIYGRQRLRGTAALQAATDHRCHERMGHCWPVPWRAPAPSAPCSGVNLRPATAARDRSPQACADHRCHERMAYCMLFWGTGHQ